MSATIIIILFALICIGLVWNSLSLMDKNRIQSEAIEWIEDNVDLNRAQKIHVTKILSGEFDNV